VHFSLAEKFCGNTASANVLEILYQSLGSIRNKYKVSLCVHAD
jgi:hypothetical protein